MFSYDILYSDIFYFNGSNTIITNLYQLPTTKYADAKLDLACDYSPVL